MRGQVVLMYHGIVRCPEDVPPEREAGAGLYDVGLDNFRAQMEALKGRDVVVTFDDGEANNFTNAFPVLRELKLKAYFFITVERVGKKGYMDWEQIRELRDAGMVIGSHGLTHRALAGLKRAELEGELYESRDILERQLSVSIDCLSVPRGFWDKEVLAVAQEAGYKTIYVSGECPCPGPCVGRTAVRPDWGLARFELALAGKTPLAERMFEVCKNISKTVLGRSWYDKLREKLLRK